MRRRTFFVLFGCSSLAIAAACGSSEGSGFPPAEADGGEAGASSSGTSGFVPTDGSNGTDDVVNGGNCSTAGKSCGDAGVCAGGQCCSPLQACDTTCCSGATICSFQKCVTPGATCFDSSDCASGEYCELSLGETTTSVPDASCVGSNDRTGKCLPKPPECPVGTTPPANGPITCLQKCELPPPSPSFNVTLKAAWGGKLTAPADTNVMMAPIVMQLDDDDCDGKITERDIPEIIFSTFTNGNYNADGKLHAVSLKNGAFVDKWTVPNATTTTVIHPTKQIAAGNFDGKPGNEVVACGTDGSAHAFNGADGTKIWSSPAVICFMPSIADLEGDGSPEVIVEGGILDGATGALKHAFDKPLDGPFVISDIDGDGQLDIVTYARAYSALGLTIVDTGKTTTPRFADTGDWKGPWSAVADFDADGKPEIIGVDNETHSVYMWRYDATVTPGKFKIIRDLIDMNALFDAGNKCNGGSWGELHGGGPPTIGDFDKDGVPDVALAGGIGYVVFDGKKLRDSAIAGKDAILWSNVTTDCSSASTGSTLFDFDGDGKAEVVYSDEKRLRVYEGATGKELASFCNTTATLSEFPIVADVDNDGQADIIVVSNQMGQACGDKDDAGAPIDTHQAGVRVFGPASGAWVRTRRVWNEHAYHVSNVNEDGTIPKPEPSNWTQNGLNNFRQNKQPGSEFAAPNLVASLSPLCAVAGAGVTITIRNVGEAAVPKGVVIGVYDGATKLGTVTTSRQLYPAEAEPLDFTFATGTPPSNVNVKIDDGAPAHPGWTECRTDDNTASIAVPGCGSGVK